MTRDDVLARIREILVGDFKIPESKITEQATFRGTLGMDSLDAVDLIFLLGKSFQVPTQVENFRELHTVGKVADHILSLKQAAAQRA